MAEYEAMRRAADEERRRMWEQMRGSQNPGAQYPNAQYPNQGPGWGNPYQAQPVPGGPGANR